MDPILLAGLGNPGDEYADTRHNIGFRVIDDLAERWGSTRYRIVGDSLLMSARVDSTTVILCKPLTYMNNSGVAVAEVLSRYGIPIENMLVIVDDLALPLGTIRIRGKGSDGGHNGLYSIIQSIGSQAFPRVRCGIGRTTMPPKDGIPEFVLSPFEKDELVVAKAMVRRAADAVTEVVRSGLSSAMNKFNTG
jgi:PTH1 family peptidyl-tRNA hydrolase